MNYAEEQLQYAIEKENKELQQRYKNSQDDNENLRKIIKNQGNIIYELESKNQELKEENELINKRFLYLKDTLLKDLADEYEKLKKENGILRELTKILL